MAGSEFGEDENGGKKIVSSLHVDGGKTTRLNSTRGSRQPARDHEIGNDYLRMQREG